MPVPTRLSRLAIPHLARRDDPRRSRGQIVVVFATAFIAFTGLCAIAVDISWYWANTLRMQKAADAAALAGVVHLPGDVTEAVADARAEATKNGYTNGVGGVVVTPTQDPTNARSLRVTLSAPVGTFFARVFGITSFQAVRSSKAEYVLPVPMGSPDAWYGIFGTLRTPAGGTNVSSTTTGTTSYFLPTGTSPSSGNWTNPTNATTYNNNSSATKNSATNAMQMWTNFGISVPSTGTVTINGIEIDTRAAASDASGCTMRVALSWNGSTLTGAGWTSAQTVSLTSSSLTTYTVGGSSNLWGRTWATSELANGRFQIRLERVDPGSACTDTYTLSVDHLRVRIHWTQVTTTWVPDANVAGPAGQILTPQGFWGVMHASGSRDINGDKYLPRYDGGGSANGDYDTDEYYNYAIEVPAGASGNVYVYDPVFCAVQSNMGTGDRWFNGTTAVWSFFDLLNTQNTLYDNADDTLVASSGSLFKTANALTDPALNGPAAGGSVVDCTTTAGKTGGNAGGAYHNAWYQLGAVSGGTNGRIYRVHTYTTDPSDPNGNLAADGMNAFGLYSNAAGAKIYGLGAMEQYSPLPGGSASVFYLAQIEAAHAGKTMQLSLWDIGDTSGLPATLQILQPTTSGWSAATLSYQASQGTPNAYSCGSMTGTNVTSITATSSGGTQYFQGCWLTIDIPIPTSYTAPQSGWWKIQYTIGGSSSSAALDLTTWQAAIKGNPVHLVVP
jgi:hypothetical protein